MVWPPLSPLARDILQEAVRNPKGAKVKGKPAKVAARDLQTRGLAALNKLETTLTATPAGRWAQSR